MKRMQIYLENDEYEALRSRAFKLRESISSVLRKLVRRDAEVPTTCIFGEETSHQWQNLINSWGYGALPIHSFEFFAFSFSLVGTPGRDVMRGETKRKRYAEGLLDMAGTLRETRADVSERHDEYLWGDVE